MVFIKSTTRAICAILAAASLTTVSTSALAQNDYPKRPIRLILGVAPGGLIDVTARLLAESLSPRLGQPIVVENKPGGNTTIGANAVRTAAPDGDTFFYGGVMSASPIFVKNQPVDFVTQMKPVSLVLSVPFYLLVNTSKVPAKTMPELVAYSKQHDLFYADAAPLSTVVMYAIGERTGL